MAKVAGFKGIIYISGTSTAFTNAPTTERPGTTTPNTEYRITDAAKRVWDPDVAVTVEVDADGGGGGGYVAASASSYTLNPLDGTVIFTSNQGDDALVRVSGNYLPMVALGAAQEASLSIEADEGDSSVIGEGAFKDFIKLMIRASGSVSRLESLGATLAADATQRMATYLLGEGTKVLEYRPDKDDEVLYRIWALFTQGEESVSTSDLLTAPIQFTSVQKPLTGRSEESSVALVIW